MVAVSTHFSTTATTATATMHNTLYSQSNPTDVHEYVETRAHAQGYTHTTSMAAVSPAAIAATLNANTRRGFGAQSRGLKRSMTGSLKASISTPNLRSKFGMRSAADKATGEKSGNATLRDAQRGGGKMTQKPAKTQFAAETWCDALMFPRPRFRAHVISPPSSPDETGNPWAKSDMPQAEKPKMSRALTLQPPTQFSTHLARQPPRSADPLPLHERSSKRNHSDHFPGTLSNSSSESPTETTLMRIVAEGQQRDREREQWNELAQSSFQNRRSRSLSRTRSRKKSGGTAAGERERAMMDRARVHSDAEMTRPWTSDAKMEGLSRTLTAGFATLAAEAFRQPTPTISTISHGAEQKTHSRTTSESAGHHRHGHSRNTSWGKTALKQLCTPEEKTFPDAVISSDALKTDKLEGALRSQKTARLRVRGRKEEAEEADVQFMDIVPLPPGGQQRQTEALSKLAAEERGEREARSNSQNSQNSNASDSLNLPVIGIALSTPPDPSPIEEIPDLSAHPYAQSPIPRMHADPMPVSAPYAGPHPTSHDYNLHRLPPYGQLDDKLPGQRMYAISQSGIVRQVSTPEISQSPTTWESSAATGPSAYAYANVAASEKRESALGVEEALLSHAAQRVRVDPDATGFESAFSTLPRKSSPPPPPAAQRVHRKPVALSSYPGIPSLSHTVTTTTTQTDVTEPEIVHRDVRETSTGTALSSPSSQDSSWSRMSPRPLGSIDDLEPFRDLFYKPGRTGSDSVHARKTSLEGRKVLSSREISMSWYDDVIKPNEGLNGLKQLTRQVPEDSQALTDSRSNGERHDERLDGRSPSLPGLIGESLQLDTPLRAEYEEGQDFPEDIQSSRASSVIEHESIEGNVQNRSACFMMFPDPWLQRHYVWESSQILFPSPRNRLTDLSPRRSQLAIQRTVDLCDQIETPSSQAPQVWEFRETSKTSSARVLQPLSQSLSVKISLRNVNLRTF